MPFHFIIKLLSKVTDILSDILQIEILAEGTGDSQMVRDIVMNVLVGERSVLSGVVSGGVGKGMVIIGVHEGEINIIFNDLKTAFDNL